MNRRTFLGTTGATLAGAALTATAQVAADGKLKKAFMLGGVTEGPVLPHFELLKEAGFEGVELLSPNKLDRDEVLRAREKTGLVIHGVSGSRHWKDTLSDPNFEVAGRGMEAVRQSIADCKAYGGTTVLLVPAVVTKDVSYSEAYQRSQENIRKLIPDAERAGIIIAIEEVWNKFLLSAPEFARYIDELRRPYTINSVRAYFDVGNVVEYGFPQEWIRTLGPRIAKIHIKEYGKAKRFDYPLGEGEIDWPAVRAALAEIGYHGWITAEVPFGNLEAMKDVVRRMDRVLGLG